MSIEPKKKQALIKKYATAPKDTGSPEVQVAILTERIANLTEHMKTHKNLFSLLILPKTYYSHLKSAKCVKRSCEQ